MQFCLLLLQSWGAVLVSANRLTSLIFHHHMVILLWSTRARKNTIGIQLHRCGHLASIKYPKVAPWSYVTLSEGQSFFFCWFTSKCPLTTRLHSPALSPHSLHMWMLFQQTVSPRHTGRDSLGFWWASFTTCHLFHGGFTYAAEWQRRTMQSSNNCVLSAVQPCFQCRLCVMMPQ